MRDSTGPGNSRPFAVEILRLGHRPGRDPRLSTHLALTARALGARALHLNPPDPALEERLAAVGRQFGGTFRVYGLRSWSKFLDDWPGTRIHLTMYGQDLEDIRATWVLREPVLLVVGGPKVPARVYHQVDYNVAVTHQPHSEVAAVALTLDRLLGLSGNTIWTGARLRVLPCERGKRVERVGPGGP